MRKSIRKSAFTLLSLSFIFYAAIANAEAAMTFSTKYAVIHYSEYRDMDDFIWRLGGQRIDFLNNPQPASNCVDRIVDRIQAILGIIPRDLRFNIYLRRGMLENDTKAYYDYKTRSIFISVDYASQGVLAHEIGHAIVNNYFPSHLPSKVQEILAQYIDKNLWSDY